MFLVDTDVLSHFRQRQRNPGVVRWLDATRQDDLLFSAVTIGEIENGIELKRRSDPAFAAILENG